jgi:hypothetical protein
MGMGVEGVVVDDCDIYEVALIKPLQSAGLLQ